MTETSPLSNCIQMLIFLWLVIGLPSLLAGVIMTLAAIYGRRFWRLRRYRQFLKSRVSQFCQSKGLIPISAESELGTQQQFENLIREDTAMCETCNYLDEKIAYYTRLTSDVIDHEVKTVFDELIKKFQNEKSLLHPTQKQG